MRLLSIAFLLTSLTLPAYAAPVDRGGVPLPGDGPAWSIVAEDDGHLPRRLFVAGRQVRDIVVRRSGVLTFDDGGLDVGAPGPLGDVPMASLVAAFWAPLATECPDGAPPGEVRRTDTAEGVRFAWIDAASPGCEGARATFSVELFIEGDTLRAVELRYEALPTETPAVEPRAGLRFGRGGAAATVLELFPDPPGGVMRGRAKWLLEGSSDGEPGAWIIEVDAEGGVLGDVDLDGWRSSDNCEDDFNPLQENLDGDEFGDHCDPDVDGDFQLDGFDNCPRVPNPGQQDLDANGQGDACDPDDDGDGWPDGLDRCDWIADAANLDLDRDGLGDACDRDPDGDDWLVGRWGPWRPERCPFVFDPLRGDFDEDGIGDWCDLQPAVACRADCDWQRDSDGDRVSDVVDVCPTAPDPEQRDRDGDGVGDRCDPDVDGDGVMDIYQLCRPGACPLGGGVDLDGPLPIGWP